MPVTFTKKEIDYIKSQHLARIATASKKGDPDVAPVGFDFDGQYFYVGSHIMTRTIKYKNILENPKVSFVIDDVPSIKPWNPRSLKIRGTADLVDHNGYLGPGKYIRIKPTYKTSFGIEEPPKIPLAATIRSEGVVREQTAYTKEYSSIPTERSSADARTRALWLLHISCDDGPCAPYDSAGARC